jgi:hypothetical protein
VPINARGVPALVKQVTGDNNLAGTAAFNRPMALSISVRQSINGGHICAGETAHLGYLGQVSRTLHWRLAGPHHSPGMGVRPLYSQCRHAIEPRLRRLEFGGER